MLRTVVPYSARQFGRAIIMPNLAPPVTTVAEAITYRERIRAAVPGGMVFEPLMTCYLTDNTDPDEVERGHREGVFAAVKLYPANATTNSDYGVSSWDNIRPVLERLEKIAMPLLIHGEEADPEIDIFDREAAFIERVLGWMTKDYPALRIVLEHVTTAEGVDFVRGTDSNIAATITPHHLMINRNALFVGGIRPHMYCLPVAKRERHRLALRAAATGDDASIKAAADSRRRGRSGNRHIRPRSGFYRAGLGLDDKGLPGTSDRAGACHHRRRRRFRARDGFEYCGHDHTASPDDQP